MEKYCNQTYPDLSFCDWVLWVLHSLSTRDTEQQVCEILDEEAQLRAVCVRLIDAFLGFRQFVFEANNKARVMKGGRKNLKRAVGEEAMSLREGQSIMQVVSLRGSNVIEVLDAEGEKSLAFFPAKFQKSMWIKRGSFVVVDDSGRDKALESGSKVACIVLQVLFFDQVRVLQKSAEWPQIFKAATIADDASNGGHPLASTFQSGEEEEVVEELNSSDDEDGLPPLEANLNRVRPVEFRADRESGSGSDSDS